MTCPDENALARLLDGAAVVAEREPIERHLDTCAACSAMVTELARLLAPSTSGGDPLIGSDVGAYRIVRILGEGGMGRVYVAIHREVGGRVAIKVMSRADSAELTQRFLTEARAVNRIDHRGTVKVIDLVELADHRPAIVMELIDGPTLRASQLTIPGAVRAIIDVLATLSAAHAIGIVHRDLKPDNILISPTGPRILDFGIAKVAHVDGPRTRTGVLLGTPAYMAPEQVLGAPADARTDLYAIGVVLFEVLTGTRPFRAANEFELMRAQVDQPPPSPRALAPAIPPSLDRVILRALAKRPEDRYADAAAMAAALEATLGEVTADGAVVPHPTPVPAEPKRRRWLLALVLVVVACAALAIVERRSEPPPPAPSTPAAEPDLPISMPVDHPLDPVAFLPDVTALARRVEPDAQLESIIMVRVRSDGTMLTGPSKDANTRTLMYAFGSAHLDSQISTGPVHYCGVAVNIALDGRAMAANRINACGSGALPVPRCTARQLWDKARALGFDPEEPATITWLPGDLQFVGVRGHVQALTKLVDDC